MSNYTTTIGNVLQSFVEHDAGYFELSSLDIIRITKDKIFNFPLDWYADNGTGLEEFKVLFLNRYYNSYIGFETLGMFKNNLSYKLNSVMPYYKKMYEAMQDDNPFINHSKTFTGKEKEKGNKVDKSTEKGYSSGSTDNEYQSIDSDNPQVTYSNNDYASNMTRGNSVTTNSAVGDMMRESKQDDEKNRENIYSEQGLIGKSRAEVIKEYSQQIFNINKELVEMCLPLFLGVW